MENLVTVLGCYQEFSDVKKNIDKDSRMWRGKRENCV